jgi:hypothetical protein
MNQHYSPKTSLILAIVIFLFAGKSIAQTASIHHYPKPSIYAVSTEFEVVANGVSIPVFKARDYDIAHFSMGTGTCTYNIKALGMSSISNYAINPLNLNIAGSVAGNVITFTILKDQYIIIWVSGRDRRLILVADPQETDVPASSGAGIFNISQAPYNADNTNTTLMTTAIQSAVNDASAYGTANATRGVVYVPSGIYKMGNLQLKSNVSLYLEKGAVLRFSDNPSDYAVNFFKNVNGTWWIYTQEGANNIKMYGRGIVDGNGYYMQKTAKFVNHLIVPLQCSNFTLDGLTVMDAACWGTVVARSNDITITNTKHFNSLNLGENDGIDICESQNVLVKHSIGIGHDDPYSTKTWDERGELPRDWYGTPESLNDVVFDDCISWTGCVGFKVGAGVRGAQSNITFKNSAIYNCSRALAIDYSYGKFPIDNVTYDNIYVQNVDTSCGWGPVWLELYIKNLDGDGGSHVTNVHVKNIWLREKGTMPNMIKGESSNATINGVILENIYMLGNSRPAASLEEMNITDVNEFTSNIVVLPKQGPQARIEAEYYNTHSGATLGEVNDEGSKGSFVGIKNANTLIYNNVDFGAGTSSIDVRLATQNNDGSLEFRLDSLTGTLIGTLAVNGSGSTWTTYKTMNLPVVNAKGKHTLYIIGRKPDTNGVANINWFELKNRQSVYATTYSDCNYAGTAVELGPGEYTQSDLNAKGINDNTISSMRLASGALAFGWDGNNFDNSTIAIAHDTACLISSGMNDKISSLKVSVNSPVNLDNTVWRLRNRHSGLYMNVGNTTTDNMDIDQAVAVDQANQYFKFTNKGNGLYSITTGGNTGTKVLEVSQSGLSEGVKLVQNPYVDNQANQLFYLRPSGGGHYNLVAKHSHKVIEVNNFSTTPGATLQQWSEGNQLSAQWQLVGAQEMDVARGNTVLSTNATFDFGGIDLLSNSGDIEFTISNVGFQSLTLIGTPKVVISGTHASDFTVISDPVTPIVSGGTSTFKIKFTPSAAGTRTAQISIASDDSDENPYLITLKGEGVKLAQTISFSSLISKTFGDGTFSLSATASSSLGVTYSSSNPAVATVSGNTVTIIGVGATTITASQAGDGLYAPALNVQQTLSVNKANQTISFASLASKNYGDATFNLTASSSSGLTITYFSSNTTVATVSGNTVTIVGGGTTTITAAQTGNNNYNAALNVQQTLTINKIAQSITFDALSDKTYGDIPFTVAATSTSGLAVAYASSNNAVATVSGNTITIVGAGITTITASQGGNANYLAATEVQRTLTIGKASQTITFATPEDKNFSDADFNLSASASSGLGVTYQVVSGPASIVGSTVTLNKTLGIVSIQASQSGDNNYLPALDVVRDFNVVCKADAPQATAGSHCGAGEVTLAASGSDDGNYRWYTESTGGDPIAGEVSSTYTTPEISQSTLYYVSIFNVFCESERVAVNAVIKSPPATPAVSQKENELSIIFMSSSVSGNQWFRNGVAIPGATNQTLLLEESGSYMVNVTVDGCSTSSAEMVLTAAEGTLDNVIKAYPNPVQHKIIVTYPLAKNGEARLYDITGKMKSIKQLHHSKAEFDLSEYETGFYTVEIVSGSNRVFKKIIKIK